MKRYCLLLIGCVIAQLGGCTGEPTAPLTAYQPLTLTEKDDLDMTLLYVDSWCTLSDKPADSRNPDEVSNPWIGFAMADRVRDPWFRSMCGIINRYFGDWDRLILLEQVSSNIEHRGQFNYGFVVLAISRGEVLAVTNAPPANYGFDNSVQLKRIVPDHGKLQGFLKVLDTKRSSLPSAVVADYSCIDTPIIVLHDFCRGQEPWSFCLYTHRSGNLFGGMLGSGPAHKTVDVSKFLAAPMSDDPMRQFSKWRSVRLTDKDTFAGVEQAYLDLMTLMWEATMGPCRVEESLE